MTKLLTFLLTILGAIVIVVLSVDNRQPVVPAQVPQGLSAPLIAAAKGYEKTKRTLLAYPAPGQRISYEDTATLVGPAVAGVLRTLFNLETVVGRA